MTYFDPQYTAALITLGAVALAGAAFFLGWLLDR